MPVAPTLLNSWSLSTMGGHLRHIAFDVSSRVAVSCGLIK